MIIQLLTKTIFLLDNKYKIEFPEHFIEYKQIFEDDEIVIFLTDSRLKPESGKLNYGYNFFLLSKKDKSLRTFQEINTEFANSFSNSIYSFYNIFERYPKVISLIKDFCLNNIDCLQEIISLSKIGWTNLYLSKNNDQTEVSELRQKDNHIINKNGEVIYTISKGKLYLYNDFYIALSFGHHYSVIDRSNYSVIIDFSERSSIIEFFGELIIKKNSKTNRVLVDKKNKVLMKNISNISLYNNEIYIQKNKKLYIYDLYLNEKIVYKNVKSYMINSKLDDNKHSILEIKDYSFDIRLIDIESGKNIFSGIDYYYLIDDYLILKNGEGKISVKYIKDINNIVNINNIPAMKNIIYHTDISSISITVPDMILIKGFEQSSYLYFGKLVSKDEDILNIFTK